MFRVVYLWRGERHVVLRDFPIRREAEEVRREMLVDGWCVWVERTVPYHPAFVERRAEPRAAL